jgi:hypothetical protein
MKTFTLGLAFTLAAGMSAFGGTTTDEMTLTSGASTVTITDNGVGDGNAANGTITYSNANFDGWNISVASGTSKSPGLTAFGLDLASLTATCASGGCTSDTLTVTYSDINFSVPVGIGGFTTTYSSTQTGVGTTTEQAYFSNLNTIFSQQNSIGSLLSFNSSSVGSVNGGTVAATPNYSLTLIQTFKDTSGAVSFSTDGNITNSVPEPASIFLFGTVLALSAGAFRRRKKS